MKEGSVVMLNETGAICRTEDMERRRGVIMGNKYGDRWPVKWLFKKEVWMEHEDFLKEIVF